jgi:hypothetical protein
MYSRRQDMHIRLKDVVSSEQLAMSSKKYLQ